MMQVLADISTHSACPWGGVEALNRCCSPLMLQPSERTSQRGVAAAGLAWHPAAGAHSQRQKVLALATAGSDCTAKLFSGQGDLLRMLAVRAHCLPLQPAPSGGLALTSRPLTP